MRYQGKITRWQDEQGYGFITPNQGGADVFVHIKSFANRQRRPEVGQIVTYELEQDQRGRRQARATDFVGAAKNTRNSRSTAANRLPLLIAGLFLAFVALSVLAGKLPLALLGLYTGASLVAFIAYAIDKSAARQQRWRTQESTLQLLALIGGWPGALIAQNRLRHKTSKASFLVVFWACVLLNCAALGLLLTPSGSRALKTALGVA